MFRLILRICFRLFRIIKYFILRLYDSINIYLNFSFLDRFHNKKPQNISMWMKNTYIPLDVLFLNKDYIVEDIKHNMKPHNTKSYRSKKKCKYAIEINGGESRDNNIKIGTRVIPNIIKKLN